MREFARERIVNPECDGPRQGTWTQATGQGARRSSGEHGQNRADHRESSQTIVRPVFLLFVTNAAVLELSLPLDLEPKFQQRLDDMCHYLRRRLVGSHAVTDRAAVDIQHALVEIGRSDAVG